MTHIRVVVPAGEIGELRRALRTMRRVAAEDVEFTRRRGPRRPAHGIASARLLAEITSLLDQLDDERAARDREVSGERGALRAAACDVLVVAIERLACAAHRHWTDRPDMGRLRHQLTTVVASVALVEQIEAAHATGGPHKGGR